MWTHIPLCGVTGGGCETLVCTVKHVGDIGTSSRAWSWRMRRGCAEAKSSRHTNNPVCWPHQRRHSIFYSQFDMRPSSHSTLKQVQSDCAWDSSGRRNSNCYFASIRIFSIRKHVSCFCIWHAPYNIRKYYSGGEIRSIIEAYTGDMATFLLRTKLKYCHEK